MGRLVMHLLFVGLFTSMCRAAPVSGIFQVMVESPAPVHLGGPATLPCWLSTLESAEDLNVIWYRGNYDTPVMHYKEKVFEDGSQEASYAGRVSFGLKDTTSGGLKAGDVSLKLVNVTIKDAGDYTCYVSSLEGYDSSTVVLSVMETGGAPLLSTVLKEENKVNVSCESEGWYPRPELRWSNKIKDLRPDALVYSTVSSGYFSVHSWLLVPENSEVTCSVGLSNIVAKESRIRTIKTPEKESSPAGWVAFGILLITALVGMGVFYFKKKGMKLISRTGENEALLPKEVVKPTDLSTASKYYENITLENRNNEYLIVRNNILRDAKREDFPDGQSVTCLTAIRGMSGFYDGKHYWEVSLVQPNTKTKKSWWIGVTTVSEIPQGSDFCPNTLNGFWFLSSSPDTGNTLQFSTKPEVFVSVQSQPKTIGVYVDYDSGEISFYNVEEKSLILSLTARFTQEVFPFFNPGKGDAAPMKILQKTEDAVGSDVNNAEPAASDPGGNQTNNESSNPAYK